MACASVLLIGRLNQGWWPHDDGSLAHSAERVLAGELPHRDFADLYTGSLTFFNAAVFAVLGEDMVNLRVPLFIAFLGFVACFFAVARRLLSPIWAFGATLFAITWSLPVYPAPMPSWYMLFLATIGLWATIRYIESSRSAWLLLAGLCGGTSIALKVVGVWFVIALVLALIMRPALPDTAVEDGGHRSRRAAWSLVAAAILALATAVVVFSGRPTWSEGITLIVPVAGLCFAVAIVGVRSLKDLTHPGFRPVLREIGMFAVGVCIPIGLLALPYVVTGSTWDLIEGSLISPRSRYDHSSFSGPEPITLLRALPIAALLVARVRLHGRARNVVDVAATSAMAFVVLTASGQPGYSIVWGITRALAPFVLLLGAIVILRNGRVSGRATNSIMAAVFLVAGFTALLQFPMAVPLYFCYVAPLILLAAVAGLQAIGGLRGALPVVILLGLIVFGARQMSTQPISTLGVAYAPDYQTATLDRDRASIRVSPRTARVYGRVRDLVLAHRGMSRSIFAGPDAAAVYFLTQSRNPTRAIIDFLDTSSSTRGPALVKTLQRENVHVIAINHGTEQSPKLDTRTLEQVRALFPAHERVGWFEVRWRVSY